MSLDPLIPLIVNSSSVAVKALVDAFKDYLSEKENKILPEVINENVLLTKNQIITELRKHSEISSDVVVKILSRQVSILDGELERLRSIANREHWIAQFFIFIAGIVFFVGLAMLVWGTTTQAVISLISPIIPGFLSKVYYSREDAIEKRIREISSDLRESEKTKERLRVIDEVLAVIPEEYRESAMNTVLHKTIDVEPITTTQNKIETTRAKKKLKGNG